MSYIDADSFYLAMSGCSFDKIVKPGMRQVHDVDKKNWLATGKFSRRTPEFFKPEFLGTRVVWLATKCYLVQHQNNIRKNKQTCEVFQRRRMI